MSRTRNGGFTLIELLIVIAVIAVLAAILIPTLLLAVEGTKHTQTVQLITQVDGALEDYATTIHPRRGYPRERADLDYSTAEVVRELDEYDLYSFRDNNIRELENEEGYEMIDGWNEPLLYRNWFAQGQAVPDTARNPRRFDLWSLGPDGHPEENLIGNWGLIDEEE